MSDRLDNILEIASSRPRQTQVHPEVIKFHCPLCGQSLEIENAIAGEVIECPTCGKAIRAPEARNVSGPAYPGAFWGFQGRIGRLRYFSYLLAISFPTSIINSIITHFMHEAYARDRWHFDRGPWILAFIALHLVATFIMSMQAVKRLHDIGRPGEHYWMFLIPFYNIYLGILLLFQPGDFNPKQYGQALPAKAKANSRNRISHLKTQSNPAQRRIIAIAVPIAIVLLGWGLMSWLDTGPGSLCSDDYTPTELSESWLAWLIIVVVIAVFEFFWLAGPKTRE